ncbi:prolyl oligopeptidase family serine peptidase [Shewanella sp. D64]|uniref:alpha/beta hydrolase family protein n=1 Tax=unclassified Shewanella TaxID=196818 RepID=UPI0022BA7017|nr:MULTISPECIES: prolyl oligopeptidase family serine peptidase [unclassified Shewanella]MEC4726443.1 prolyl oligopeptidase family serine peptidase [Shewanella sp. D64]WBJ94143.1 prolyl oligopeptidase family serine peptidase [Shewanella sp. MTB7]
MKSLSITYLLLAAVSIVSVSAYAAKDSQSHLKTMTTNEIMKFESLKQPVVSTQGNVLAVEVAPDRGDSHGLVKSLTSSQAFIVDGGSKPQISHDGRFVAFVIDTPLLEKEVALSKEREKLKSGMTLLDTQTGKEQHFERVKEFSFNQSGTHLAVWFEPEEADNSDDKDKAAVGQSTENKEKKTKVDKFDKGSDFTLVALKTGASQKVANVNRFYFDKVGHHLVLASNDTKAKKHQLVLVSLESNTKEVVRQFNNQQIGEVSLSEDGKYIAFTHGDSKQAPYGRDYHLSLLDIATGDVKPAPVSKGWKLNRYTQLRFSEDSKRLFFGRVPQVSQQVELKKIATQDDLFDQEVVTGQRGLRIWHGEDARIKPNEIKQYKKEQKRTYLAVLHLKGNNLVQLADTVVPDVDLQEQSRFVIGSSDIPYRKMITWAGFYRDYYLIDLNTGYKTSILVQQPSSQAPSLSPNGRFAAYYQQGDVYLYQVSQARRHNLTKGLTVSFADEDHDYPSNAPGYGFGPWLENDGGLLIYDKYDIWQMNTASLEGFKLTAGKGRKQGIQYRVTGLVKDENKPAVLASNQAVLLHGYNERTKGDGYYQAKLGTSGVITLMEGDYKLKTLVRSEDAQTIVFSKERYDLFPDLYSADYSAPQKAERQTDLDVQKRQFNWGESELVHWTNGDGQPLDGVLIKPTNYVEGKRYPVLVYFYRFMSDRLNAFPSMKLNHRPNFAWYADNGYAIFLPDIRFEVGYPGATSVQALTSGVQKIIEMGVADPDAIGIQGHSWGGYQTAFAVTQTHIFKAAVTGAPVSNMTSAYSGIRHGSGLARQFQYETGQSRIGESLFRAPQKYIENSPIFYAERIKTPMMIMFGDKDDAVPWEQGIELYLAMRRAGKDVVFLQYEDEPHHLKKYPNKLDYSIRMMEYFGHYLKGEPAPSWLTQGEAYTEYKKAD